MGLKTWLGLKKNVQKPKIMKKATKKSNPYASHTVKYWPVDLAEEWRGPIVTFGISLKSATVSNDWDQTQILLGGTLRSIFRQSDPRWRVIICGHEMPDIPEMADRRVEFVASEHRPPQGGVGRLARADKYRKRFIIGERLRSLGGGYFMALDADDLLHRDLVATGLATQHGCLITTGYIFDAASNAIAPMPGVLSVDFDRICGSMAIIQHEQEDFPQSWNDEAFASHFGRLMSHGYARGIQEESGRPLSIVPFPAAIYVTNTGENITYIDKRRDGRSCLASMVQAHAITDPQKLDEIADHFGWRSNP